MTQEFRGFKNLVYARVTKDDATGYTTGPVKPFAPAGEIKKTIEQSTATHFYDDGPAIVISAVGEDTVEFSTAIIPDEVLADITGQYYDPDLGMLVEGVVGNPGYFAVGYQIGVIGDGADGDDPAYFIWRYKGTFGFPSEEAKTADGGTDANGQTITYKGINTRSPHMRG